MHTAYEKLRDCDAAQKHMIIISDGDPSPPTAPLLRKLKDAKITCTGIAVFPHNASDVKSLLRIAKATGGRFYHVKNPNKLPRIFIKEAMVIRRPLIIEETFPPRVIFSLSEIVRGLPDPLPNLDGYILTGPKGGLSQPIIVSPKGDPILATGQAGLGRCVAFTSSADSRWASSWIKWGGFDKFWEQTVRWASKSSHTGDCEIFSDVQGQDVTISVEAVDASGNFVLFADMAGQVIDPQMSTSELQLSPVGPGMYRADFRAEAPGSYLINLRYRKIGDNGKTGKTGMIQSAVTVPHGAEFSDLSDNSALLREVARITGGRVVKSDPNQAGLFDAAGVKFPATALPLTRTLILIWLVIFLLDVAVRRIALDVRAIARRVISLMARVRPGISSASSTLDRLKLRKKQLSRRLAGGTATGHATKRFEARPEETPKDLPAQAASAADEPPAAKAIDQDQDKQDTSSLQHLLKVKRNQSNQSGDN